MNESALAIGLLFFGAHLLHNQHIFHWLLIAAIACGAAVFPGKYVVPKDTRTIAEQRKQYEQDIVKFYADCYMDAVRIIINTEIPPVVRGGMSHAQLMTLGREAIFEAIIEYGKKPGLDNHVYETIRKNLFSAIKASA